VVFTSDAILAWAQEKEIIWHFIAAGNPMQNRFALANYGINLAIWSITLRLRIVVCPGQKGASSVFWFSLP